MHPAPILSVANLCKTFATNETPAVNTVSFQLQQGEILGLLGPSGCGKTTLLRLIAGFESPTSGTITLSTQLVSSPEHCLAPEQRNTGMVFQDYALFPHLSIADNVAFGLRHRTKNLSRKAIQQRVQETLELVGLCGLEKRFPHELSGGQQQRIALARALAPRPSLILLDEPLSNLDVQVRHRLRHEIRQIIKASGISAIFVTHDQEEALAISDRIAVMRQGHLEQFGTPEEIYTQPSSRFVAEFVTHANFLPATLSGDIWKTEIGNFQVSVEMSQAAAQGELMVREEELELVPNENSSVIVRERQFLGREYRYCLQTDSGKYLHARTGVGTMVPVGSRVKVNVHSTSPQVFAA
ncbi:MAG: ABC transporter ATP-binding protein [Limnothrix sp.]